MDKTDMNARETNVATTETDDLPLKGRTALITGATRGIGRAVALGYAKAGAHVIALGRSTGALEELDDDIKAATGEPASGAGATLVPMNLKGDKLDSLGPNLIERFDAIDVLVGNAGILGPLSPIGHVTTELWQEVMDINVTANFRLIRTIDPLLRRSDAGRAIFVSSGAAQTPRAYWGPYAASKGALEALVKSYAAELANTRARANLLNPGATATAMRAKAMPGEDPATITQPEDLVPLFLKLASPDLDANGKVFGLGD